MNLLHVHVGGEDLELDGAEVHYLTSDGSRLRLSTRPPEDVDRVRQLGYFVFLAKVPAPDGGEPLERWFFHVDNLPAARILRLDGRPITNLRQEIRDGAATVSLAPGAFTGPRNRRAGASDAPPPVRRGRRATKPGRREGKKYVIGRAGTNADIQIDDPLVRARHATVRLDAKGAWWIAGPIYVDGSRHMSATLSEGDTFVIGQTVVTVSPDLLPAEGRTGAPTQPRPIGTRRPPTNETGLAVELDRVTVYGHEGNTRLDDVSLSIAAGEVVAVVGPSGAGKSSLIKVLLGELPEAAGNVHIGPRDGGRTDLGLRRRLVRYVPQADDLYPQLTVRETLTYAARLRAAPDTGAREIADRVGDVLQRLTLDAPERLVGNLSGGQRRRVSIGLELVGDPKLLLLDEPTSGLDPGKDRAIMEDLRQVSELYRCTVIVVTHSTAHLDQVDKLVVIAKGGQVRYVGAPGAVLATLGQSSWADLMLDLDQPPPPSGNARHLAVAPPRSAVETRLSPRGLRTLLARQVTLLARRGQSWYSTLLMTSLACTAIAWLASGDGLRPGPKTAQVLAILVTVAALTGASMTYLDLVHEFEILRRDWRVGVEVLPMAVSKAIAFGAICAALSVIVAICFAVASHLPGGAYSLPPLGMLVGVLFMIMLASMGVGLLISAISHTLDKAVARSTLLAVFQVTLSGALFQLKWGLGVLAMPLPARLGVAAIASYVDLNRHRQGLYKDWMWDAGAHRFWALVVGLGVVFVVSLGAAVWRLQHRWRASAG